MFSPLQLQLSHPYWHEKCHVHLLLFSASCIGPGQSSWGIGQAIHWANHSGTRAASPPLSAWSNGTNPILKSWTDAIAAIQKNQVFSFGALNIGGFGIAYLFFFTGNAETALEMGWFPPCWMGLMKQKILGRCFSTSRPPMDYQFIQNPIPIKWFLYWYYLIFRHIHLAELWYLPLKAWGWFPWYCPNHHSSDVVFVRSWSNSSRST